MKVSTLGLLSALVGVFTNCAHAPPQTVSSPTAIGTRGTVDAAEWGNYPPQATFWSQATGQVLLNEIGGDTMDPCRAEKLYISLVKSSDLGKFVKLIKEHRILPIAKIDDPTSGHTIYTLHGVLATGKRTSALSGPIVTLKVASLTLNDCGPRKTLQAPYTKPPLPTLP
jgi:hypothetical protein